MEVHLRIIGVILIILATIHVVFPRYFNWAHELVSLSLINRQIMYVHTFFIGLGVLLMGVLCLKYSEEILGTELGKVIALGFGIFWAFRLFVQFFWYSSELWKGKKFETVVHALFSILWTYLTIVFLFISIQ